MKAKQTVYVGMSGGVDSSVTAALLQHQGYRVVGVYMQNWTLPVGGVDCPWKQDLADARAVAAKLGIPLKVFDFQAEYKARVVDAMVAEYAAGRTPNPDVLCNQEIKFKLFLEAALADGTDLIATGHYARAQNGQLMAGVDAAKDQSYFLYRVTADALKRSLMPLGELTKPEVRRLAAEFGLPTATKKDSQGICFVGQVGIKDFLSQYLHTVPGPIVLAATGKVIGQHDGAEYYTVGQRHGLGLGGGRPYYVIDRDIATNTVYVTTDTADLMVEADRFELYDCHWINDEPAAGKTYGVVNRYHGAAIPATLSRHGEVWQVQMERADRALSTGQSAVVYDGERVVGGGLIRARRLIRTAIEPAAVQT